MLNSGLVTLKRANIQVSNSIIVNTLLKAIISKIIPQSSMIRYQLNYLKQFNEDVIS